eukprot:scaffold3216_cov124-Cylindrotheca_fusiformis.AAC.2
MGQEFQIGLNRGETGFGRHCQNMQGCHRRKKACFPPRFDGSDCDKGDTVVRQCLDEVVGPIHLGVGPLVSTREAGTRHKPLTATVGKFLSASSDGDCFFGWFSTKWLWCVGRKFEGRCADLISATYAGHFIAMSRDTTNE